MRRVLEPGQIEAFAQSAIPRIRLPDRSRVFAARARRLSELGGSGPAIADYLRLMAALADAQQAALARSPATLPAGAQLALAREHGMPPVSAAARGDEWHQVLGEMCVALATRPDCPAAVRAVLDRLRRSRPGELERQADALLAAHPGEVDAAAAPFLMAALQVCAVDVASRLPIDAAGALEAPGVCPMCGTLPVASVVRTDERSAGYRYLHCALCATEWHMVRVTCSHCQATNGISYQSIEGAAAAIRAECCDSCRTYRKIFYQEHDRAVEPVADDLASLALDLLLGEAGYHRASGNPLLWLTGTFPISSR
jgi:FdhE protein